MTDATAVGSDHLRRAAFVYIRQSSLAQVENNTQSTRRQYALVDKALGLGWPRAAVSVVTRGSQLPSDEFVPTVNCPNAPPCGVCFRVYARRSSGSSPSWMRGPACCTECAITAAGTRGFGMIGWAASSKPRPRCPPGGPRRRSDAGTADNPRPRKTPAGAGCRVGGRGAAIPARRPAQFAPSMSSLRSAILTATIMSRPRLVK
jgi:hypothetical protein